MRATWRALVASALMMWACGARAQTTLVLDSFVDTGGTALTAHTPSGSGAAGGAWVMASGTSPVIRASGAGLRSNATSDAYAYNNTTPGTATESAQATFTYQSNPNNGYLGIAVRMSTAGTTRYELRHSPSAHQWQLYALAPGIGGGAGYVSLANYAETLTVGSSYTFSISVSGTSSPVITCITDGATHTFTDTNSYVTTAGYTGITMNGSGTGGTGDSTALLLTQFTATYTPAANATGYSASLSSSSTTVGTPVILTLTLTGGSALSSNLVITPALGSGLTGTFSSGSLTFSGSTVTIPNGTTTGTIVFTPTAASGAGNTIGFTHTGGGFTGGDPGSLTLTVTVANTFRPNSAAIFWSPGVVYFDEASNAWLTENGTYFKTTFTGTSLVLNVDLTTYKTNSIAQAGWGQFIVHLDSNAAVLVNISDPGAGINVEQVTLASGLSAGTHTIEAWFNLNDETDTYTPKDALVIDSFQLDAAATLTAPTASTANIALRPKRAMVFGDSITKGYKATDPGGIGTSSGNVQYALSTYAQILLRGLDAEGGIVGKSGQGWLNTYNAWTGLFPAVWKNDIAGQARSFPALDYLIVNEGTNDTAGSITATVQTWLSSARAAVQPTTWIVLLVPFNGSYAANLAAAVAGYTAMVNVTDAVPVSSGFDTVDGTHPQDVTHAWYAAAAAGKILAATAAPPLIGGGRYLH
jgi:hypothetical protein